MDVVVVDGRVSDIAPTSAQRDSDDVDLEGRLLLPGFVDLHVHLDKAFQLAALDQRGGDGVGGLAAAIAATAALRRDQSIDDIRVNAERLIDLMRDGGTVAARAHVEVGPDAPPELVDLHLELARQRNDVSLELCAFAQHGTTGHDGVVARLEAALRRGVAVLGGCPYSDDDPRGHLSLMLDMAREHDVPLDLHLDLSDDAADVMLGEVARAVMEAGLEGRVVVGHATALTALPPDEVAEIAALVCDAGITVVAIPTTDLYLSGRDAHAAPTRGVTRIRELWRAGVAVALATNNHENAFTPVSTPSLSQVAWLASLTNHIGSRDEQLALLDAITEVPRRCLTIEPPGLKVGKPLAAAAFDVTEAVDVVRASARPCAVFRPIVSD